MVETEMDWLEVTGVETLPATDPDRLRLLCLVPDPPPGQAKMADSKKVPLRSAMGFDTV